MMRIDEGPSSGTANSDELMCRVFVPKRNLKKTVRLDVNDTVWEVKIQFIYKLALENEKEDDPWNFGVYLPKAGVYLEEQRQLSSYYFSDNVYFEFKPKVREQKIAEKVLQKLNGEKQQKQFYEYQTTRQHAKMRLALEKGFDPNFIYKQNNECPLTLAALNDEVEAIVLLFSVGGAFLDYRSSDGKTPLHKAAIKGKYNALKALLKQGASANARDKQNLTPLYDACVHGKLKCAEALLEASSPIGIVDSNNRTELHQACANNFPEIVDLLIAYGADINSVNEPGNTPLHICATKNNKDCAQILLKNGASKDRANLAGNSPFQVAIMFNNHELAEMISSFKAEDVVPVVKLKGGKTKYDDDPVDDGLYLPPMPPPGTVGIYPPPADAPARKKVFNILPPPPPPATVENPTFSQLNAADGAESIRSDSASVLTADFASSTYNNFPPLPNFPSLPTDLPPPPPQDMLDSLKF